MAPCMANANIELPIEVPMLEILPSESPVSLSEFGLVLSEPLVLLPLPAAFKVVPPLTLPMVTLVHISKSYF